MFRKNLFSRKFFLISGGGSGIGRAIAHELSSLGAHVIVASRKEENLREVVSEIQGAGGKASCYPVNIRDESSIKSLFSNIQSNEGELHGIINNAGGQFPSPAENITKKGWNAVVETNLTGTFLMSREAFETFFKKNGGVIINMVAEMWRGFPGMAHTGAARAGVVNLTKTLAVEWAFAGVRVNAVAPGTIKGNGLNQYDEFVQEMFDQVRQDTPVKRFGTESEVSSVVTFLLSPASGFITGETIKIDGGGSLWRKTWDIPEHDRALPLYHGWNEKYEKKG